jgi:hypothetical protein
MKKSRFYFFTSLYFSSLYCILQFWLTENLNFYFSYIWYQITIHCCFWVTANKIFALLHHKFTMPGSAISEPYKVWRGCHWTIWGLQGWSYRARWLQHPNFCICCTKGTQWKMGRSMSLEEPFTWNSQNWMSLFL